jgi:hypothetical protein
MSDKPYKIMPLRKGSWNIAWRIFDTRTEKTLFVGYDQDAVDDVCDAMNHSHREDGDKNTITPERADFLVKMQSEQFSTSPDAP